MYGVALVVKSFLLTPSSVVCINHAVQRLDFVIYARLLSGERIVTHYSYLMAHK